MVLRRLLTEILGVSQHYEANVCCRKLRHKGIMLLGNFAVFLLCEVTELVSKSCASVHELCLLPTCRATWNPMRGLGSPDNFMSNIHIRNVWGISILVSLLPKEEVGEEWGSGLATKGRTTYHLPSALGQKIEISYLFLSFLFSFSLSFIIYLFLLLAFYLFSVNLSIFLCCIRWLPPFILPFTWAFLSPLLSSHNELLPSSKFASFLSLPSSLLFCLQENTWQYFMIFEILYLCVRMSCGLLCLRH